MDFTKPQTSVIHRFPGATRGEKSPFCDVQDLRAQGNERDRKIERSLFAKLQRKFGDINTSLKKRKVERRCLRKTRQINAELFTIL